MQELRFEKLHNTRDLGGMTGAKGRQIRYGKLIRSGRLGVGSEADIRRVGEIASLIVDFRSSRERAESPDPIIEGTDNVYIPIIDRLAAGVSRDKQSDEDAFRMLAQDPDGAFRYMCSTYVGFVSSESALAGYRSFISLLLEKRDKAVLWHCTAGKDRAGFASVIILEMLGVKRDVIFADYLRTNERIASDVEKMIDMFGSMNGGNDPRAVSALRNMFEARKEYLESAYAKVDTLYGDFAAFLAQGLHLNESDIEAMRTLYLV